MSVPPRPAPVPSRIAPAPLPSRSVPSRSAPALPRSAPAWRPLRTLSPPKVRVCTLDRARSHHSCTLGTGKGTRTWVSNSPRSVRAASPPHRSRIRSARPPTRRECACAHSAALEVATGALSATGATAQPVRERWAGQTKLHPGAPAVAACAPGPVPPSSTRAHVCRVDGTRSHHTRALGVGEEGSGTGRTGSRIPGKAPDQVSSGRGAITRSSSAGTSASSSSIQRSSSARRVCQAA